MKFKTVDTCNFDNGSIFLILTDFADPILFVDSGAKLHGKWIRKGKCSFPFLSVVLVVILHKQAARTVSGTGTCHSKPACQQNSLESAIFENEFGCIPKMTEIR